MSLFHIVSSINLIINLVLPLIIQNDCTSMSTVFNKGFLIFRYATPFGLNSEYAHPAEILFLGFATIAGPAITGPHLITLWLWM